MAKQPSSMLEKTIRRDPKNTNRGTPEGRDLIKQSIEAVGYTRPGVVTSDNVIIAGNHMHELAEKRGDEPLIIDVPSDRPVFVRRTDLHSSDPKALQASILDNQASRRNYNPDMGLAQSRMAEAGLTAEQVGFTAQEVSIDENASAVSGQTSSAPGESASTATSSSVSTEGLGEGFSLFVRCKDEEQVQELYERLTKEGFECRVSGL